MAKTRAKLKEKIKSIVLESDEPIDVYTISKQVNCTWHITFRTLIEIFIEELEKKSPNILNEVEIRPLKTTKSFVFIPQK